jgi:hypothetical protein
VFLVLVLELVALELVALVALELEPLLGRGLEQRPLLVLELVVRLHQLFV